MTLASSAQPFGHEQSLHQAQQALGQHKEKRKSERTISRYHLSAKRWLRKEGRVGSDSGHIERFAVIAGLQVGDHTVGGR